LEKINAHAPYIHETGDADTAVLFIHGFMGSPNQFRALADAAVNNGYSVFSILLPGHGYGGLEFARSKKADWEKAVKEQIDQVRRKYSRIVLTGHSMGALLSLRASVDYPDVVKGVAAIAAPMYIRMRLRMIKTGYDVAFGRNRENDERLLAAYEMCSVERSSPLAYLIGIPRYIDLFRMISETKAILGKVEAPVLIIHSEDDEIANVGGVVVLEKNLKKYEKHILKDSGHFYISPGDSKIMEDAFIGFVKGLS
jgi:carboxylesterase